MRTVIKFDNALTIMNNDLPPSWKFEEVVTINCEFSLFGLTCQVGNVLAAVVSSTNIFGTE